MFMVEPAHFICLCWITHVSFPMRPCGDDVGKWTCSALHVASTMFVGMWIVTFLAVIVLILTVTLFDRHRQSGRWWEDTLGTQATLEESLNQLPIPDHVRRQIVGNLPKTNVPPADGEPCAICFDISAGDEWYPLSRALLYLIRSARGTLPSVKSLMPASMCQRTHGGSRHRCKQ